MGFLRRSRAANSAVRDRIGQNNSSEILWLSSLPARIKKTGPKMKALECLQDFPHYIPRELSVAMETRVPI